VNDLLELRRARLASTRLYLVCDAAPGGREAADVLGPALEAGVDIVQLRDKRLDDAELLSAAERFRALCEARGALFFVNDRPDLARRAGADGVHVGQDDMDVARARELAGPELLVGRSTHAPDQLAAAHEDGADYIAVGPVHETPTKPGRPAAGLGYVEHAAAHATLPWFAIGGIDLSNVAEVVAAGARRVVVVRAIAEAQDVAGATQALRKSLERAPLEAGVGTA
jgi:thiamine-phosphate pyrophosphorylase